MQISQWNYSPKHADCQILVCNRNNRFNSSEQIAFLVVSSIDVFVFYTHTTAELPFSEFQPDKFGLQVRNYSLTHSLSFCLSHVCARKPLQMRNVLELNFYGVLWMQRQTWKTRTHQSRIKTREARGYVHQMARPITVGVARRWHLKRSLEPSHFVRLNLHLIV